MSNYTVSDDVDAPTYDRCLAGTVLADTKISLSVSSSPPDNASAAIDPSFAGFGIEPSNLFSFTGTDQPNSLTFNLIDNLVNYTGYPPHMRIGGNTEDYMIYREDQTEWAWVNNEDSVGQGTYASDSMLIGPKYFEAANRFPEGTPVTWGLNLAYEEDDWADQISTMLQQVINDCTNLNLVSVEIGNEPDLYLENGFRSGQWTGQVYTEQWLQRMSAVYDQVLKPLNMTSAFFEPGCTASTIGIDFQIDDLAGYGISAQGNDSDTSYIKAWNQHDYYYFLGVSTYSLTLDEFQQLSTTDTQFAAWVEQVNQALDTPYPYALREMGLVGPVGLAGITDTFAAALWTLNFLFYAATLGISSVQFHMTDNSAASPWQPVELDGVAPFVRPVYYGHAAFDQTIGPTCTARVAAVDLGGDLGDYDGYVRAYAVYQADSWQSMVVINSKPNNVSEASDASISVELSLPTDLAGKTVYLGYLSSAGSDATANTTWNGLEYESSGDGTPTAVDDGLSGKSVQVGDDGTVTVDVRDTQAVVVQLGSKVGEGLEADSDACASFTSAGFRPSNGTSANGTSTDGEESGAVGYYKGLFQGESSWTLVAWVFILGYFVL
ncbi:hypothetical protein KJ359_007551 [Pestalotiopsis sp. 9143b]|nr:hypothetical protein KJ359_007551 [Pestalotiopsis sp. 9143b]